MIWLFQRRGEYLSCEVRTCLRDEGYELYMLRPDGQTVEWYPDVKSLEARWQQLREDLQAAGWGDLHSPRVSSA